MRGSELVRRLSKVPAFAHPRADREQVATPPEAAVDLLTTAIRYDGVAGRSVVDLGCGTGRLAIGAALLGASPVWGVESDPDAAEQARTAAASFGVRIEIVVDQVGAWGTPVDLVVMNPPFGAQRAHADRPFWDRALATAQRSIYAFALSDSRTFIARRAVERGARILETRPVDWELERTFPHHTRRRVRIPVDLWAIQTGHEP